MRLSHSTFYKSFKLAQQLLGNCIFDRMSISEFDTYFIVYMIAIVAILGLVMGSFLNCMAIRIVNGEPIARGRSHCMSCGHTLGARDLVPLFSWLFSKGKCRYCGEKVSGRYPLTELVSTIVYVSVILKFGLSVEALEMLILVSLLLVISFCDIEDYLIPDRFIVTGIIVRIAYLTFISFSLAKAGMGSGFIVGYWTQSLIGGLCISVPVLILAIIMEKVLKRDAMGGGDIKLLFMIGIYFPWMVNLFSILVSCVIGIIVGMILLKQDKKMIPFGPAICAGSWIGMLFGTEIISAYLGMF